MVPIENEKRIDWNLIKAEYIGGASYGVLAKKYGLSKSTVFKKARQGDWGTIREQTANAVQTKTIEKTAEAAADNAAIAADLKKRLLLRMSRLEQKFPMDATQIEIFDKGKRVTFKLRDLTASFKDLTEDMQMASNTTNDLLQSLLDLEKRAGS